MPDPTAAYTLQQVAHMALGTGTSQNAAVVGRVMAEFSRYFHSPGMQGYKWKVRWQNVAEDHPDLIHAPTAPQGDALTAMTRALTEEIAAVRREMEQWPIVGFWIAPLDLSGDGSFLYEVGIELSGDAELPIPEGVAVLLRWRGGVDPSFVEGTLLSYDPPTSRIIIEVARPFTRAHLSQPFHVLPRVDELLVLVQKRLATLKEAPAALSWRLLRERGEPRATGYGLRVESPTLDGPQKAAVGLT